MRESVRVNRALALSAQSAFPPIHRRAIQVVDGCSFFAYNLIEGTSRVSNKSPVRVAFLSRGSYAFLRDDLY
jgi:hypothetical protein